MTAQTRRRLEKALGELAQAYHHYQTDVWRFGDKHPYSVGSRENYEDRLAKIMRQITRANRKPK